MKPLIVFFSFFFIISSAFAGIGINKYFVQKINVFNESDLETINENMFKKKTTIVHFYTSAPNAFKNNWKLLEALGNYKHSSIPPSGIKLEFALSNTLGLFAGSIVTSGKALWKIFDSTASMAYEKGFRYNSVSAFAGLASHLYTHQDFDSYLSANVGYTYSKFDAYSFEINNKTLEAPHDINPIFYYANFGMRYLFSSQWGVFVDGGIGTITFLNAGIIYKLGK
jgi:hypothetical protein